MQSVFDQSFTDYEYIIIDGGSTDGSTEYIELHSGKIAYWISEKDDGVYDALNKGVCKSNGDYLMFLNSGDYLMAPDILNDCFKLVENPGADIYYGDMIIEPIPGETIIKEHPKELSIDWLENNTINHQSAFIRRALFFELGLYNNKYSLAADHAFFIKCMVNGKKYEHLPVAIVYYDLTGMSSKKNEAYRSEMETIKLLEVPGFVRQLQKENKAYKMIMGHKIMKIGLKLDKFYQRMRKGNK